MYAFSISGCASGSASGYASGCASGCASASISGYSGLKHLDKLDKLAYNSGKENL